MTHGSTWPTQLRTLKSTQDAASISWTVMVPGVVPASAWLLERGSVTPALLNTDRSAATVEAGLAVAAVCVGAYVQYPGH